MIPMLVRRENLSRANAFLQQLSSFVKIDAPILGGVIVGALGPHNAMVLDVLSFIRVCIGIRAKSCHRASLD
ncbi:MAG: hypothetical protein M3220_12010 [Chloroflexota bacterium]|nr:hypothetical protein [Chloroflexota bacterium]